MKQITLTVLAALLMMVFMAGPAHAGGLFGFLAQDEAEDAAAAQPEAAAPARGEALEATIVEASPKRAQVSFKGDDVWVDAKPDMKVSAGAKFRTGRKAIIKIALPPDQTITIDSNSVVTLLAALKINEQEVKTDIGMERGRTVYEVSDQQVNHEASIRSPSGTHAVRGTYSFGVLDTGSSYIVFAVNNPTQRTMNGQTTALGGEGQSTDLPDIFANVANWEWWQTINDPSTMRSRTPTEMLMIGHFPGLGGRDFGAGGENFRGGQGFGQFNDMFGSDIGSGIPFDAPLLALLCWNNSDSDLDIFTRDADGFVLSPFSGAVANARSSSPNGGLAGPDSKVTGITKEYIVYTKSGQVPVGSLEAGASLFSGSGDSFKIKIFRNGKRIRTITGSVDVNNRTDSKNVNVPSSSSSGSSSSDDSSSGSDDRLLDAVR